MLRSVIIGAVLLSFITPAFADCAEEMARMAPDGVAKDGGLAPLEQGESGIAKDGSHMPLEGAGDHPQDRAMSQQDVEAQQAGKSTAAEQALTQPTPETLARAKAALAAGDEEECLRILKEM